jgi:hypothetical protein
MSHSSSDKYLYFTVGLLKDSFALDALRQDAVKHHMVDHPGQLIALRLTEYYEMMSRGIVQPVVRVPAVMNPVETEENSKEKKDAPPSPTPVNGSMQSPSGMPAINQITGYMRARHCDNERIIFASPDADQNADEAADYWSTL